MVLRMITILSLWLVPVMAGADPVVYTPADLDALPFLYGREYFVLRSGRVQMVVQADRMDLGTSFGYLLFDAQDAGQSVRKANAFNFDSETGLLSSALSVELGGHAFSAVGDRTVTQWVLRDGIPTVQATWWAGGVRVTEQLRSLASDGVFSRLIRLEGAHLAGEEHVFLNLTIPSGPCSRLGTLLVTPRKGAVLAIAATGDRWPVKFDEARASLRIGPITVTPEQTYELETLLLAQVPSGSEQDLVASVTGAAQAEQAARNAWAVLRLGYTLLGAKTKCVSPGSQGYEVDFFSTRAMDLQFAETAGKLIADAGPLVGKTLKYVHDDSYEVFRPNPVQPTWTPEFRSEFLARRGYDPLGYLAVLTGQIVDSREMANRFLWDYRRTIGDLFAAGHLDKTAVEETYSAILERVKRFGTEVVLITPHFTAMDWMGMKTSRERDTRPYVHAIYRFAERHQVAVLTAIASTLSSRI